MRTLIIAAALCILASAADRVGPPEAYPPKGIGRWNPSITQENIHKTICVPGYTAIVRSGKGGEFGAITESIKKKVYERDGKKPDGLPPGKSHCCEIDHADPLLLAGANVIDNLWAESWDPPYGARQKDHAAEDKLHELVCRAVDPMPLKVAQKCIEEDWIRCAKQIAGK